MPRRKHRKLFWADVHRLFGVWSLWGVFIIALTGIWYFLEVWGLRADYPTRGNAVSAQATANKVLPAEAIFSNMISATQTKFLS